MGSNKKKRKLRLNDFQRDGVTFLEPKKKQVAGIMVISQNQIEINCLAIN